MEGDEIQISVEKKIFTIFFKEENIEHVSTCQEASQLFKKGNFAVIFFGKNVGDNVDLTVDSCALLLRKFETLNQRPKSLLVSLSSLNQTVFFFFYFFLFYFIFNLFIKFYIFLFLILFFTLFYFTLLFNLFWIYFIFNFVYHIYFILFLFYFYFIFILLYF